MRLRLWAVLGVLLCACANGWSLGVTDVGPAPLDSRANQGVSVGVANAEPAPLQYVSYGDTGRYMFNPVLQNWTDASQVCREYNGHLSYPDTEEEASVLWDIMSQYNVKQVHAGFHDQFIEGVHYTVKGQLLYETDFSTWSPGGPVGNPSLNCGGLMGDGLAVEDCKELRPSVCEENEQGPGGEGFKDYDLVEGHGYYKYNSTAITWPKAMTQCYQDGAHLWIINSESEKAAVYENYGFDELFSPSMWVGVHQRHAPLYFVTIFAAAVCCYSHSNPGADRHFVCGDCSTGLPYCGHGKCNVIGCNCEGGCRRGRCEVLPRRDTPPRLVGEGDVGGDDGPSRRQARSLLAVRGVARRDVTSAPRALAVDVVAYLWLGESDADNE